jgi:hypothetical protein
MMRFSTILGRVRMRPSHVPEGPPSPDFEKPLFEEERPPEPLMNIVSSTGVLVIRDMQFPLLVKGDASRRGSPVRVQLAESETVIDPPPVELDGPLAQIESETQHESETADQPLSDRPAGNDQPVEPPVLPLTDEQLSQPWRSARHWKRAGPAKPVAFEIASQTESPIHIGMKFHAAPTEFVVPTRPMVVEPQPPMQFMGPGPRRPGTSRAVPRPPPAPRAIASARAGRFFDDSSEDREEDELFSLHTRFPTLGLMRVSLEPRHAPASYAAAPHELVGVVKPRKIEIDLTKPRAREMDEFDRKRQTRYISQLLRGITGRAVL